MYSSTNFELVTELKYTGVKYFSLVNLEYTALKYFYLILLKLWKSNFKSSLIVLSSSALLSQFLFVCLVKLEVRSDVHYLKILLQ